MPKPHVRILLSTFAMQSVFACSLGMAQVGKSLYPAMHPLDEYLIEEQGAEIALARAAAPASISGDAEVMALQRDGYATVVKGSNGFVCLVERSWAKPTDDAEFWNPKVRAPNCFNGAASSTFLQVYLKKTKLVLAGKSPADILNATDSAFSKKELPPLAPGAMCYMLSGQQYLSDEDKRWHPHVMFFVSGNAAKSWGANLKGSPIIAGNDPEERVTVLMMMSDKWSDGTAAPSTMRGH